MHPLDQFEVIRLIRNESAAWREFVQLAAPWLRAIVRRTLAPAGRAADVADVLQEVFARLCREDFRLIRLFDPEKGRFSSWLGVLTARAAIDHLRKVRTAPLSLDAPAAHFAEPIAPAPAPDTGDLPLPTDVVSPQQELILRLCYEDDLDVAEIARFLHTQPQTVRAQRHKALERLRVYFAQRKFF